MKYKIILKTTHKNFFRVENCLSTWLKGLDFICLTDLLTGKVSEFSGSDRHDYYSAEEKTVNMINHIKTSSDFDAYDWFIFIDDDAILNTKFFEYVLPHFDKNLVYGLPMGGYQKAPQLIFPSGGASYTISKELIKKNNAMNNQQWGVEDVSVGKWLNENQCKIVDRFTINDQKYYLKLGGWWQFPNETKQLTVAEQPYIHQEPTASKLVKIIKESQTCCDTAKKFMTHHYIRSYSVMNCVHELFQSWHPGLLERG